MAHSVQYPLGVVVCVYLAGVSVGGAESVQQAQATLRVRVSDLAPGWMPGQTADREAFLMLLPAAQTRHRLQRLSHQLSTPPPKLQQLSALPTYLSTHSLLLTSHTAIEPPTLPAARNRPQGDQATTLMGCRDRKQDGMRTLKGNSQQSIDSHCAGRLS